VREKVEAKEREKSFLLRQLSTPDEEADKDQHFLKKKRVSGGPSGKKVGKRAKVAKLSREKHAGARPQAREKEEVLLDKRKRLSKGRKVWTKGLPTKREIQAKEELTCGGLSIRCV